MSLYSLSYRFTEQRPKRSTDETIIMLNLAFVRQENRRNRRCDVVLKSVKPEPTRKVADHG